MDFSNYIMDELLEELGFDTNSKYNEDDFIEVEYEVLYE